MDILTLHPNLICYQFPPKPGKHYGYNIYALLAGQEALLIDSAYQVQAEAVRQHLNANGITPRLVVVSHFHDDHIYGLKVLPGVCILGSPYYQTTLDLYCDPAEQASFHPHRTPVDGETLTFGDFQLRFLIVPGHAVCNLFTLIDDSWLHIGDEIMTDNQGHPILPWVERSRLAEHIASLERLKDFRRCTLLPSHGVALHGEEAILEAIEERLSYLRAVEASPVPISYPQASAACRLPFLHAEWHDQIYDD